MEWSAQQDAALKAVAAWFGSPMARRQQPIFRLFGYAGSGKTTLAIEVSRMVGGGQVLYAAFTGKAALVMDRKGCVGASTIHRLIYNVREDPATGGARFYLKSRDECSLTEAAVLVIDECSMVDEDMAQDLLSFRTPILVIGDPAQLPPVKGAGYFINAEPDVMLTEIHRQARDNPIIRIANIVREGGRIPMGNHQTVRVIRRSDLTRRDVMTADQVLVGLNRTRREVNGKVRAVLREQGKLPQPQSAKDGPTLPGIGDDPNVVLPVVGDKLVCLRNAKDRPLYNGSLWRASAMLPGKATDDNISRINIASDDGFDVGPIEIAVANEWFRGTEADMPPKRRNALDQFDFGYALTCHKAQGSQWDRVLVWDEGFAFKEFRSRWLYTACSRAVSELTVIEF